MSSKIRNARRSKPVFESKPKFQKLNIFILLYCLGPRVGFGICFVGGASLPWCLQGLGILLLLSFFMVLNSFIATSFGFRPMRVEVVLTPGVSQIQILGLPDAAIKESSKRILSALRYQGFRMPPGKQALVNLYPQSLKKTSQGVDLAIALGILLESEQLEFEDFDFSKSYVYGALTLKGEVEVPSDLEMLNFENFHKDVLTGNSEKPFGFVTHQMASLGEIHELETVEATVDLFLAKRPEFPKNLLFPKSVLRLMSIVALGEHSLLLAGNAGAGKTTMMENIVHLLDQPEQKQFMESKKYWKLSGRELQWRPVVQPHHSLTPLAMIGGGRPPRFGEISLAHGGALLLDELLEFHPQVQSALREPMEKGSIYISRIGSRKEFPAKSLTIGTTNLCACGKFHPEKPLDCRCSSRKLRQYLERLSGPFLDRFSIFYLMSLSLKEESLSFESAFEEVEKARGFASKQGRVASKNHLMLEPSLRSQFHPEIKEIMIPTSSSHRRRLSLLRVARTLADLEQSPQIMQKHLEEAQIWTSRDSHRLQSFRFQDFATR